MKYLLTLILSFLTLAVFAQKRDVFYLKNDGSRVLFADSADFVRVFTQPGPGSEIYDVQEFYKDGKQKLTGKSLSMQYLRLEGKVVAYYNNGQIKTIENYTNGNLSGEYHEYFSNGKVYTIRHYPKIKDGDKKLYVNYDLVALNDSAGKVLVADRNGYYTSRDSIDFAPGFKWVNEEGHIKDGRRDGEWKGYEEQSKIKFTEIYENGFLKSGVMTDSAGNTYPYKERLVPPGFAGGLEKFNRFLMKNIRYPAVARENNIMGRVFLNFIVAKDGSIKELKVLRSPHKTLSNEALRVMAASPKWQAGAYFGVPVDIIFTVPLAFNLK